MTEVFHWRFWSFVLTAFPAQVGPATDLHLSGHREENEHGFLHTLARTDHAAAVWEKNIYIAFSIHVRVPGPQQHRGGLSAF